MNRILTTLPRVRAWRMGYCEAENKIQRGPNALFQTPQDAIRFCKPLDGDSLDEFKAWYLAGWNDALGGKSIYSVGVALPGEALTHGPLNSPVCLNDIFADPRNESREDLVAGGSCNTPPQNTKNLG